MSRVKVSNRPGSSAWQPEAPGVGRLRSSSPLSLGASRSSVMYAQLAEYNAQHPGAVGPMRLWRDFIREAVR